MLYGDDSGLIRDRAALLVRVVAGATDDPFRVIELARETIGDIPAEMASLPLTGGRRVVVVRDAGDAAAPFVQVALAGRAPGFLVLEAPGLATRAKLRSLMERAADGIAIACYPPEGRALEQSIRDTLSGLGVRVDSEALTWLGGQLGADQAVTRSEVEKLALYAGRDGQVDITAARVCVGDLAGLSLDDALFAATAGDVAGADRALELAMAEGAAPVGRAAGGADAFAKAGAGAAGDGRRRLGDRCHQGGASAGVLQAGAGVPAGAVDLVGDSAGAGVRAAVGGGAGLQAHRRAGGDAVSERHYRAGPARRGRRQGEGHRGLCPGTHQRPGPLEAQSL